MDYINKYSVWTVARNRDGSPNNETLEGVYDVFEDAQEKAAIINGEIRYYINETDYN